MAIELDLPTTRPNFHGNLLARAYSNRGIAYEPLDDYRTAINDFTKAIQVGSSYDSVDSVIYNNQGNTHSELSQHQQAIRDYDKAIQLDPDNAMGYYNRGITYG